MILDNPDFLKLGIAGIVCIILWIMLNKSEKREEKKDLRIVSLEKQLLESYDESIAAADQLANALHGNAAAMNNLVEEIRNNRNANHH